MLRLNMHAKNKKIRIKYSNTLAKKFTSLKGGGKYHINVPWKKLSDDREVWRASNSTHKKNNIWMTQSTHYSHLTLKNKKDRHQVNIFAL